MEDRIDTIQVEEEIQLSQSAYTTPAPIRGQVVIHADADEMYRDDASKAEYVPILSEAMKEIIDVSQNGECKSPTKQSAIARTAHSEDHSHFATYVAVAVSPSGQFTGADKENTPPTERNIHPGPSEANENQNNSSYPRIVVHEDSTSCPPNDCQVVTSNMEFCKATHNGDAITVTPIEGQKSQSSVNIVTLTPLSTTSDSVVHGVNIDAPILNGYQKPKMNIVQQIVQAFNASHKKEMHPSEVYEQVQMIFPYYRHLSKKKKKSWMSSVRHALTSSRFKGRRVHDENPKSVIRKGSLWSLNENFNADGGVGVRKKNHSHRKGSSRRKQKLAGRTRQDLEDLDHQFSNNSPKRMVAPTVFTPAAPEMSHMQSTFAPGAMVFPPNYPIMSYMHHQSSPSAVCQHSMPGQQWMTMQPCKPTDIDQRLPQNIHQPQQQVQQMTSGIPPSHPETVNMVHHSGQPFQMQAQGPDDGQVIYQSMNLASNNDYSQPPQQNTSHSQHSSRQAINQHNIYQAKTYPTTKQEQHNTPGLHSISHPVVHNNQPVMMTTLQPQNCGQPLGSGWQKPSGNFTNYSHNLVRYGNSHLGAQTSMNWSYSQPGPHLMQMVDHQQFGIHCSPVRSKKDIAAVNTSSNSEAILPASIYPAVHFSSQSDIPEADATRALSPPAYSNDISPSYHPHPGSYQEVHLVAASDQYLNQYHHESSVDNSSEAKTAITK